MCRFDDNDWMQCAGIVREIWSHLFLKFCKYLLLLGKPDGLIAAVKEYPKKMERIEKIIWIMLRYSGSKYRKIVTNNSNTTNEDKKIYLVFKNAFYWKIILWRNYSSNSRIWLTSDNWMEMSRTEKNKNYDWWRQPHFLN